MRISTQMQMYFHNCIASTDEVYLFGSRTDDNKRGGDIDVFILSNEKYETDKIRHIKTEFMKEFGWQKLDVVNWTFDEKNTFRDLVEEEAIRL